LATESQVMQPVPISMQKSFKNPAKNKEKPSSKAPAKPAFTPYENLLSKFSEFLEAGEWKRAQQANNQSCKIWPNRIQYFTFNFAL
jgi:hypothetical protein